MKFRLAVLGDFRFTGDGCDLVPPPTLAARSLLTYLIWSRGAAASREKLIELFWPESEPERGRSSLSTALWSIRRSLRDGGFEPDDVLEAGRTRIAWLAQASLDAHEFELRASADDWGEQQSALELYRGAFLEGHYDDWSVARREHLDALYQQVLMLAVTRADDVESARRLIERGSFDEEPYALLAQAELALGRHGVAAAIAARCREVLAEVGERPSASFEARFAHVGNVPDRRVFELPFCGREAEFSALGDAFRRAIDGQGGIVVVQGPAGSGKSELLRKATAHPQAHAVNLATVAALDRDPRAFGPWLPLYERMTGKTAADFSSGGGNATTLADAVVDALGTPGMLVVDDAQFLSGDALQVLVRIARRAPHEALQLAIAVRSEGVGTLLPLLPRHRAIALGPISNPDLVRALESIAPANVHAIADFLTARSGGHAFFAAQLFESLIASKALRHESGSWSFDASSDAGRRTPATIDNFIDARLRAKGNDAATVACALALEPSASSADLVAVCGLSESQTLDAVDDLLALGLVEQPSAGPEFRFGHDLIRERAAHVLNSGRRLALHRSFAKIFEPGKRDLPLQHARHLGASGQMFPAAQSYCKAASELLEVNAWRDAMESATSGLQAIDALAQTRQTHALAYRLHRVMMRSKQEADDYTGLVAHIEAGIERARESRDPELTCTALLAGAWMIELAPEQPERALRYLDVAFGIARDLKDERFLRGVWTRRCYVGRLIGDQTMAIESARSAYESAERSGDAFAITHTGRGLLIALAAWWRFPEASCVAEALLTAARAAGSRVEMSARLARAYMWEMLDRFDDARRELEIVSDTIDAAGAQLSLPDLRGEPISALRYRHRVHCALVALACGRWDEARLLAGDIESNPFAVSFANRRSIGEFVRIEAALGSGASATLYEAAHALALMPVMPDLPTFSFRRELLLARAAASAGVSDAPELLAAAGQWLAEQAERMPADADRAFAALAAAARHTQMDALADDFASRSAGLCEQRLRATARAQYYR